MSESYSVEAILSARDAGFTAGMKAAQKSTESLGSILKKGIGFGALRQQVAKRYRLLQVTCQDLSQE